MLQRILGFLLLLSAGQLFLSSCTNEVTCTEDLQKVVNLYFYTIKDDVEQDTVIYSFAAVGMVRPDSAFTKVINATKAQVTLSPLSDTSVFVFTTKFTKTAIVNDTLVTLHPC